MKFEFFMMNDFSFRNKLGLFTQQKIDQYVNSCLNNTQSIVQTHQKFCLRMVRYYEPWPETVHMKSPNTRNRFWKLDLFVKIAESNIPDFEHVQEIVRWIINQLGKEN